MRETQELVAIVPWTFLAQICNLFIQLSLMKRFLFRPVNAIIEKRKAVADGQLADAEKAKRTADELQVDSEAKLEKARTEAEVIVKNALEDADTRSQEILREAKAQAAAIRARAESDILMEKKKAAAQLKNEIGGIAMDIAGKVIGREIKMKDHKRLIEQFIRDAGKVF